MLHHNYKRRNRYERKEEQAIRYGMNRDMAISVIIGVLLTFLPFWEWDNAAQQIVGCLAMSIICEIVLIRTTRYTVFETIFFLLFGRMPEESLL